MWPSRFNTARMLSALGLSLAWEFAAPAAAQDAPASAPAARTDTSGGSPRAHIAAGKTHFDAGRYAEALEEFNQAAAAESALDAGGPANTGANSATSGKGGATGNSTDAVLPAEILHNQAAAHFKLGQYADARELWVRAASLKDAAFEAQTRFNLGNVEYAEALEKANSGDAQAAVAQLDKSLEQYRDALRLDPKLASARANFELAAKLRREILEQSQQQPQSQPSSQPQSQPQSQPSSQPQSQPSSQPQKGDKSDENSKENQQNQDQQDQQKSDENQQQDQQDPQSQPSDEQNPEDENKQQPQSQPESQPQSQPAPQEGQEQQVQISPEEAERLLQKVRDAEKRRREMLRLRQQALRQPVKRDW